MPPRADVASSPTRTGHVEIRGVRYYFEVHGRGEPLLLLHGGLGSIEMMAPVLPALAAKREVIAVDLHGRTALGGRTIRYADQGDDMADLLTNLATARST